MPQYYRDHRFDETLFLDVTYRKEFRYYYSGVINTGQDVLKKECGMVGIIQFGGIRKIPEISAYTLKADQVAVERIKLFRNQQKEIVSRFFKAEDTCSCKAAFPNPAIGEQFDRMVNDFMVINTTDSRRFEKLQQILIDTLDKGKEIGTGSKRE